MTCNPEAAPARSASVGLNPTSFGIETSRPWMASCMAVSAEMRATIIRTSARSSMRKNCRIAGDYSLRCFGRGLCLGLNSAFFPLVAALVTGPSLLIKGDGNSGVGGHVGDCFIELLEADVERLACWAFGLLESADAIDLKHFRDGLVQNFVGFFRIFETNI